MKNMITQSICIFILESLFELRKLPESVIVFHLKLEKLQIMILDDSDLFSRACSLHHVNVVHHFIRIQDGIHLEKANQTMQ